MEWRPAGWSVCLPVNLPLHHKIQKFSSGTSSPGWSRKGLKWLLQTTVYQNDTYPGKILTAHLKRRLWLFSKHYNVTIIIINASGCTLLKISVANFLISLAMTEKPTFCFGKSLFLFIISIPFYSMAVLPWELSTGVKNNNGICNSILSQGHNFRNFCLTFLVSSLSTRLHSYALQWRPCTSFCLQHVLNGLKQ